MQIFIIPGWQKKKVHDLQKDGCQCEATHTGHSPTGDKYPMRNLQDAHKEQTKYKKASGWGPLW